ncbi:MAG: bifunctional UDP-N-acetylglucosamine diphosphorylase/glucosamine-1-phosphate N-acetyltransferase GlmU, partial [Candidatus Dadabacteria bacterium]
MSAPPLTAIVLAAGLGKRMKSALPKALIPVAGKPMVIKVIEALKAASVERIVVVIGHKGKDVESAILNAGFNDVIFSLQKLQLGTGDAAKEGLKKIPGDADNILILPADVPLISADYISDLFQNHTKSCADVTLLTTTLMDPAGYGRIIRDRNGNLTSIKEDKDCTEAEKAIKEVNVGIYCFKYAFLREALKNLSTDNAQKEYYITDTIHAAFEKGLKVEAINIPNPSKLLGANTRFELFALERIVMEERIKEIMENGGSVPFPQTVLIEEGVTVGDRVSIGGNVQLLGETVIEDDVTIE